MQRNTRVQLAFVLAAIGGGLLIYGGLKCRDLPQYSEQDLANSTELNLSLDVARLGPDHAPPAAQLDTLRKAIRAEVENEIAQERQSVQNWFAAGLVLLAIASAQLLLQRFLGRNAAPGQAP
ncbi:MAG: hypothetical protein NVS9B10_27680 [Nevskia sp.]